MDLGAIMTERISYPVNQETVDTRLTLEEELYDSNIEQNVLNGILNPRFVRWFNEDSNNPEPVDSGTIAKIRYRTCKLCPYFDPNSKLCEVSEKFMPIKVQFKETTCPKNKWDV